MGGRVGAAHRRGRAAGGVGAALAGIVRGASVALAVQAVKLFADDALGMRVATIDANAAVVEEFLSTACEHNDPFSASLFNLRAQLAIGYELIVITTAVVEFAARRFHQ